MGFRKTHHRCRRSVARVPKHVPSERRFCSLRAFRLELRQFQAHSRSFERTLVPRMFTIPPRNLGARQYCWHAPRSQVWPQRHRWLPKWQNGYTPLLHAPCFAPWHHAPAPRDPARCSVVEGTLRDAAFEAPSGDAACFPAQPATCYATADVPRRRQDPDEAQQNAAKDWSHAAASLHHANSCLGDSRHNAPSARHNTNEAPVTAMQAVRPSDSADRFEHRAVEI